MKNRCHCGNRAAGFLALCVMCAHLGLGIAYPSVKQLTYTYSPQDSNKSGFAKIAIADLAVNDYGSSPIFKSAEGPYTALRILSVNTTATTIAIQAL